MAINHFRGVLAGALVLLFLLAACAPKTPEDKAAAGANPPRQPAPPAPEPPAAPETITHFEDCVAAGYPVTESPRMCHGPGGVAYLEIRN
jgi:hypothetical protein